MKKYMLLFVLIMIAFQGFSQDVQVSEEFAVRTDHYYEIIGKVSDKVLLFRKEASEFKVQTFSEDLKSSKEEKLELGKNYLKFIGIVPTSKDFTILFSYKDKGETYVKAHKYDSELTLKDSTTIRIFERRAFSPTFQMTKSQNKQYCLLYNVDREKILETLVFDVNKMALTWEHNFAPKDFYYRSDFLDFFVANDGSGHLILERDNEKIKRASNRFEFFSYFPDTEKVEHYMLSMSEKLWYDVYFDYDNLNKKIVAGGLYANEFQTKTLGYFYLNINPRNEEEYILNYTAFDEEFVSEVLGKRKRSKKDGFSEVDIQEIVLRHDGGVLLIAERNREYVRQVSTVNAAYSSRDYTGSQTDYHYNELLVFSIHPTGELHWKDILHKKQYSQDDNAMYSSYFLLKTRSNLRFLYNDEIKEENTVNEYIVTGIGKPDRKNIMNTQGAEMMLVMKNALQISADEIIIPSERRRQLKLVKLTY